MSVPTQTTSGNRGARRHAAFTLIEMLVVIGIIVLLIAVALPAFNFITGSRSTEASGNLLDSALGLARNNAIGLQRPQGVAVFHDTTNDRTIVALVEPVTFPFPQYQSGTTTAPVVYNYGQYATAGSEMYVCIEAYQDTTSADAPATNTSLWKDVGPTSLLNGSSDTVLEFVSGRERQFLPVGIDCRGIGNTVVVRGQTQPSVPNSTQYRHPSPAVVLFDAYGQLAVVPFKILPLGLLGSETKFSAGSLDANFFVPPLPAAAAGNTAPYFSNVTANNTSQIGFMLFDGSAFRNANGGATEATKDVWLDNNAASLLVNHSNGTLIKGD